jgi:hypothetical protein
MQTVTNQTMKSIAAVPKPGLADLGRIPLEEAAQEMLENAARLSGGDRVWQARKLTEARELLALGQIAPRVNVVQLDLRESLRAAIELCVPVAVRKNPNTNVDIKDGALIGITYPEVAVRTALPGYAFLQVLEPRDCWSASISADVIQALCLGSSLPAGIRCKDLVVMAYGALAMQTVQFDVLDAAGVMNVAAATWWQANIDRVPLTRAPFLSERNV